MPFGRSEALMQLYQHYFSKKYPNFSFYVGRSYGSHFFIAAKVIAEVRYKYGRKYKKLRLGDICRLVNLDDFEKIKSEAKKLVNNIMSVFRRGWYIEEIYKYRWLTPAQFIKIKSFAIDPEDIEYYKSRKKKIRRLVKVGEKKRVIKEYKILKPKERR